MMTHRMRISRRLRSARTSALTTEERRQALQAAERAAQMNDRPTPEAGSTSDATPTTRADIP
jgi:hypothetical protein